MAAKSQRQSPSGKLRKLFPRVWHARGMAVALLVSAVFAAAAAAPKSTLHYAAAGQQEAVVAGTSTLHNWIVKGDEVQGTAAFSGHWGDAKNPITLDAIALTIPVKSLKSSEGGGMDDTMYKALDLKHHAEINFKMTSAKLIAGPAAGKSDYQFEAAGDLTVAGKTNTWKFYLDVTPDGDKGLTITTSADLKMTTFGIKPPTAMLGMIKSGDSVTVKVRWQLKAAK